MNSDELVEALGEDFYEVKRLVAKSPVGQFVAYSTTERAFGETMHEALQKLYTLLHEND